MTTTSRIRDHVPARRPDARTARNPVVAANERKDFDATANIMATRFDAVVVVG